MNPARSIVLIAALALLSSALGGFAGALLATTIGWPAPHAISVTTYAPASEPEQITDIAARIVLRADGTLALAVPEGYRTARIEADRATRMMADAGRAAPSWEDAYALPEALVSQRLAITLGEPIGRTIVIDNPLANETVPDSLYRLVAEVLATSGPAGPASEPFSGPSLRLRAVAVEDAVGETVYGLPTIAEGGPALDPALLEGAGFVPDAPTLAGLTASWPALARFSPDSVTSRLVSTDEGLLRIIWSPDWQTFLSD